VLAGNGIAAMEPVTSTFPRRRWPALLSLAANLRRRPALTVKRKIATLPGAPWALQSPLPG